MNLNGFGHLSMFSVLVQDRVQLVSSGRIYYRPGPPGGSLS